MLNFKQVSGEKANFKTFSSDFAADVKSGTLPSSSFIVPRFLSSDQPANSQHAPQDARYGDNLIADVYEALRSNDDIWMKSAQALCDELARDPYPTRVLSATGTSPERGRVMWCQRCRCQC